MKNCIGLFLLIPALILASAFPVWATTDFSPQKYDGKIYRVALGSGNAPSAAEAALVGIKTGDMVENTDDGALYIMHATNVYTKITAAGAVTLTSMVVPLASNKVFIGNASGTANEKTLSGLFTTGTGGTVTATTTGPAVTNSSATVTASSLSVSTNATATATVTAGSLSVSTNATASATVTAGSLAVGTNVALTTHPVLDGITPLYYAVVTGITTGVTSVIYFTNATLTVSLQTTTGFDATGAAITNSAGGQIAFSTGVVVTAQVATNTLVNSIEPVLGNVVSTITSNLATVVSNATIQTATLNYAATNDPAVTVTAQNTTLNYAATNAPTVTVTAQNTTLNYAATNAPTITSQTATFVKP